MMIVGTKETPRICQPMYWTLAELFQSGCRENPIHLLAVPEYFQRVNSSYHYLVRLHSAYRKSVGVSYSVHAVAFANVDSRVTFFGWVYLKQNRLVKHRIFRDFRHGR